MSTNKEALTIIGAIDTTTSPFVKGFKKKEREKGRNRLTSYLVKGRKKARKGNANEPRHKLELAVPAIEATNPSPLHTSTQYM